MRCTSVQLGKQSGARIQKQNSTYAPMYTASVLVWDIVQAVRTAFCPNHARWPHKARTRKDYCNRLCSRSARFARGAVVDTWVGRNCSLLPSVRNSLVLGSNVKTRLFSHTGRAVSARGFCLGTSAHEQAKENRAEARDF